MTVIALCLILPYHNHFFNSMKIYPACKTPMSLKHACCDKVVQIIRIHHEYEGRIEKSVSRIDVLGFTRLAE